MDTVIVGIDLGTTNSVIVVPGAYENKGVISGPVTVIADEVGRTTQASVVCWVEDHIETGEDAKALAAEGTYTPVRFVKKYMGTQEKFKVGDKLMLPEEVSAEVLKHMVGLVKQALGVNVVKAVITHPAYFDSLAINATKEAARLAGLDAEKTLVIEPVAAAMAYTRDNPKPKLRVLVYDLGGGTFDITLVDKAGGSFVPISFGGNRELGGYNFDKKIALRMLDELRAKNYQFNIDSVNPERDPRWASLMHHAEMIKFLLTDKEKADVRKPGAFKDHSTPPKSVQLNFGLTRKEFEELIEPEIQETLRATWKVLRDAKLISDEEYDVLTCRLKRDANAADERTYEETVKKAEMMLPGVQERLRREIDHLVLVGGSCRVPAIARRLQATFGLEPELDEDILDLSVGVGAALIAMTAGTTEDGVSLDKIDARTNAKKVTFAGQVHATPERPDVGDCAIVIRGGVEGDTLTTTQKNGKFYAQVTLMESCENEFVVEISKDGTTIYTKSLTVTHDIGTKPAPPPPPPILSKPIAVSTDKGLFVVAPEGSRLEFRGKHGFLTLKESKRIDIVVYQEDIELSALVLEGMDKPLPVGTRLELETEIRRDYSMKMKVSAPKVGQKWEFDLKLPPLQIPDIEQLRTEFNTYASQYRSLVKDTPDGPHKARIAADGDRLVEETEELLQVDPPERMQIYMNNKKLLLLTKQLSGSALDPSKGEMDRMFELARDMLPEALREKPSLKDQSIEKVLDALQKQADAVYLANDPVPWKKIAERVMEIIGLLTIDTGGGKIDPHSYKRSILADIGRLQDSIVTKEQADKITQEEAAQYQQELTTATTKLDKVDLGSKQAIADMSGIYQKHVRFVENALVGAGSHITAAPGSEAR